MLKYALYDYFPKRMLRKASFEEQEISRRILLFKTGHNAATAWAVRAFVSTLSMMNLEDTIIIPIPASCQLTYTRRFSRFMKTLCKATGAINGFSFVKVNGHRNKAHIAKGKAAERLNNISIDTDSIKGKKVVIIDDICTTGNTAEIFTRMIHDAGADVRMILFLGKTKNYRKYNS